MHNFIYPEWAQKVGKAMLETLVPPKSFPSRIEQEFLMEHAKRFLPHRRATLLVGLFLWCIYGYRDWCQHETQPEQFTTHALVTILAIRFSGAVVVATSLLLFWTREMHNEKVAAGVLVGASAYTCFAIVAMLFVVPAPINYEYYFFGLILAIVFCFSLLYIFAMPMIILTVAIAGFLVICNLINPIFQPHLISSAAFYYFSFCFVGLSIAVRFEINERNRFVQEHALDEQRQLADSERQQADEARARAEKEAMNAQVERERSAATMAAAAQQRETLIALLKRKNEERERFIRAAYHDTMQPLAAIGAQTMAMKLAPDLACNTTAIEALAEIERAGRDIGEGMRGIYDLFQWGTHEPKQEAVSVNALLMEIDKRFAEQATLKHLQFRVRQSMVGELHAKSDYAMLKRVIENLVSNAIKYTEKGGIVIGVVGLRRTLRIDVRDSGIGIAPEQRSNIFEEFYQVDEKSPGIGLGLSIVRLLIERLPEHRLSYNSQAGRGSRFSIDLPKCDASAHHESSLGVAMPIASLAHAYVIVVENNQSVLNGLQAIFEASGCIVRAVTSLSDFRALLEEAPDRAPDVVVSDYRLRDSETGGDIANLIEQHFDWTVVPIVFYSADLDIPKELFAKSLRYFQRKGASMDRVIRTVQEAITAGRAARSIEDEDIMPNS
ncbi:MAG: sensor histidine kinase [Burkholderiales bacterium]